MSPHALSNHERAKKAAATRWEGNEPRKNQILLKLTDSELSELNEKRGDLSKIEFIARLIKAAE